MIPMFERTKEGHAPDRVTIVFSQISVRYARKQMLEALSVQFCPSTNYCMLHPVRREATPTAKDICVLFQSRIFTAPRLNVAMQSRDWQTWLLTHSCGHLTCAQYITVKCLSIIRHRPLIAASRQQMCHLEFLIVLVVEPKSCRVLCSEVYRHIVTEVKSHFGRTCRLHLQFRLITETRDEHEANSKSLLAARVTDIQLP
jgi:hypothetical protein